MSENRICKLFGIKYPEPVRCFAKPNGNYSSTRENVLYDYRANRFQSLPVAVSNKPLSVVHLLGSIFGTSKTLRDNCVPHPPAITPPQPPPPPPPPPPSI